METSQAYYQIYETVRLIPKGRVATYGQVADLAGLPRRARLVGRCLKLSDLPDLPWYRVLRADGRIAFAPGSEHADIQRVRLLEEGVVVSGHRVALKTFKWQPDMAEILHRLRF